MLCCFSMASSGPARAYTAYVSNERDNTISVVDLDQMKTVETVPVGQRPRGITMTKDGKRDPGLRQRRRHHPDHRHQDIAHRRQSAIRPRSRDLRPARLGQSALCLERRRQHGDRDRRADTQGDRARYRPVSNPRAWRSARTARPSSTPPKPPTWRTSSTTRRARWSPACWSTRGRASPCSSTTARRSGSPPSSAAPSA